MKLFHTNFLFIPECEHVTRDIDSPDYNADIAGDLVEDTPAVGYLNPAYDANCEYIFNPNYQDCQETPYENITKNFMSSESNYCTPHFTWGQARRMRTHLANLTPNWGNVLTTVDELYQPFEAYEVGDDSENGVISIEDNGDGTAEVCRTRLKRHRFQRSFNYVFEDTAAPDPSSATTAELPVVDYNTYQFNVRINEVNPELAHTIEVICTRGLICETEAFIGGTIITTEVLGSMNLTIRELNEIQVKDPNLFESLLSEKYHIITKTTAKGAKYQIVIFKE